MTISRTNVKELIKTEDDFGHELRVGRVLSCMSAGTVAQSQNVRVSTPIHGGTYVDPVTGKPRQFDFRSQIVRESIGATPKCVLLSVECKNLHESSPLLVCGTERSDGDAFHTFIESRSNGVSDLGALAKRVTGANSLYPPDQFVGKSLVRLKAGGPGPLKTEPQGDLYDKWSQAIASCQEPADAARLFARNVRCNRFLSFVLPVVVVPDDRLWRAVYDRSGELSNEPEQTNECNFFVASPVRVNTCGQLVISHIHFVTLTGLGVFLSRLTAQSSSTWERIFSTAASDVTS